MVAEHCRRDLLALEERQRHQHNFSIELEKIGTERGIAEARVQVLKDDLKQTRARLELARGDEQHLENVAVLEQEAQRHLQCQALNKQAADERAVLAAIKVDPARLEALQQAECALQVAIGQRDLATTSIEVTALRELTIDVDGKALVMREGDSETRRAAAQLDFTIPDVAQFKIVPPQTTSDLDERVSEQRALVAAALEACGVNHLAEAFAADARRQQATHHLKTWNERRRALLGDEAEADIKARLLQLRQACKKYEQSRISSSEMLGDRAQVRLEVRRLEQDMTDTEQALDAAQSAAQTSRTQYEQVSANGQIAAQAVVGLEADLRRRQVELAARQQSDSDESLRVRLDERTAEKEALHIRLLSLQKQLAERSAESVEALLLNARASCERAQKDLAEQKTTRAVLEDRLAHAQADGRFEKLEHVARVLAERKVQLEGIRRRAAAAERLWDSINYHRDATRKAYLQPLKEGIERLGRIVFGADFEIVLADDWTLSSCTREGKTIPFDALSIGAKEQLGILTRLAAAKIISRHGGVPVIIDDALGFSDPGRLETMGAALAHCGQHSQIILLTCTPGRFSYVGNAEVVRL